MDGQLRAGPLAQMGSVVLSANSAALIERPNGTAAFFLGNNAGNGEIYQLTEGQFSDDGMAINSYYTTAFLSRTGATGRDLFGYLTAYAQGSGMLNVNAFTPGDATETSLATLALSSPAPQDLELMQAQSDQIDFANEAISQQMAGLNALENTYNINSNLLGKAMSVPGQLLKVQEQASKGAGTGTLLGDIGLGIGSLFG